MSELVQVEVEEVPKDAESVLRTLRDLNRMRTMSSLAIGNLLYEADQSEFYKQWTYEEDGETKTYTSIEQFAFIEFSYERTATQTLMRIYKRYVLELGVDEDRLQQIGWGKLKMLLSQIDETNAERWLAEAENNSQTDLRTKINEIKDAVDDAVEETSDTPKWVKYAFAVTEEQAEVVETTMRLLESNQNLESDSSKLEFLCSQYLISEHAEGENRSLEHFISVIESTFGVQLMVVPEGAAELDGLDFEE